MKRFSDLLNESEEEIEIPEEEFDGELDFDSNKVPGGLADGMNLEDLAQKHGIDLEELECEFEKGLKVEAEHSYNKDVQTEIVMDHLFEDPYYYEKLATIENEDTIEESNGDLETFMFDIEDDMEDED